MQISCVNYKKLDQGTRLDAEYYKPSFLEVEKILRKANCKRLDDVSKSIKSFGAYALCNEMVLVNKGIPFIRCKDIKEGFVDFSEVLFIDEATNRLLSKSAVTPYTVMLTMSGTVGNSTVADPAWEYPINSNQDIAKIETNELVNPCYLTIFLNGKYGKSQTERLPIGSIQQHIFIWQLKGLLVLIASKNFQDTIARLYEKAVASLSNSETFYREAEQILLSGLGLLSWKPKHCLSFIKNFSDTQASERIDAEYFQPMYEDIIKSVERYKGGFVKLGEVAKTKRGSLISDTFYSENKGTPYIRGADFSGGFLGDNKLVYIDNSFSPCKETKIKKGDIVFALIGTVGATALVDAKFDGAFISNNLGKISTKNYSSTVLQILLHSVIGKMYFQKEQTQTAQPKISDKDIHGFILPLLKDEIIKKIETKYIESRLAKGLSMHLLDIAKRGVEMAIEKSEKDAQNWIDAELKKMDVEL